MKRSFQQILMIALLLLAACSRGNEVHTTDEATTPSAERMVGPDVGTVAWRLQWYYADEDGDGFGNAAIKKLAFLKPTGYVSNKRDCDDGDAGVNPNADEVCDDVDNDCNSSTDEDVDADGDEFTICDGDCDDGDEESYPDAPDTWYDGTDSDCAGDSDWDQDGDGYDNVWSLGTKDTTYYMDCDDTDPDINPMGIEVARNGVDEDCDGEALIMVYPEERWVCWFGDDDRDGYGASSADGSPFDCKWSDENKWVWWVDTADAIWAFQVAEEGEDCDDANADVNPDDGGC